MEGGQKSEISLESALDVKSSDQLVPVSKPLFQHNRQRFQGSTLPTSLRYEHNGWACGWDVYEFEVDVTSVETEPAGYTVIRQKLNDNPTYIFRVRSGTTVFAQIWYNAEDTDNTGGLTISRPTPSTAVIAGENNGSTFEITVDMVTGDIGYDSSLWYISESSYFDATQSSGVTELGVTNLASWVLFNCAVIEAEDMSYEGENVAEYYSCEDGKHTWKDTAGGAWTVECEVLEDGSASASVNGEQADASLGDGGKLYIGYDTEYSDAISVSASGTQSHFQLFDLDVSQSYQYVSTSSSGNAVDRWSVLSSGSAYLYPSLASSNKLYLLATVPYWSGLRLNVSISTQDRAAVARNRVSFSNGSDTMSADSRVYVATCYYVSAGSVSFHSEGSEQGSSAAYFIGAYDMTDRHVTKTDNFGTPDDCYGSFTYCVCVLNRLVAEDDSTGYPPFETIDTEDVDYTKIELAPWWDGGDGVITKSSYEAETGELDADGNPLMETAYHTADFKAGFYVPAEEQADGTWKISVEGVDLPVYYDALQVVGDGGEFDGYVRLEEPLAFYNQEAEMESWSGSLYSSTTSSASIAGASSVDIACELQGNYLQNDDGTLYYWGYTGYIAPYFYSVGEDGRTESWETRMLNDVSNTSSGASTRSSVSVYFDSGPLTGITARITTSSLSSDIVSTSSQTRLYDTLSSDQRSDVGDTYSVENTTSARRGFVSNATINTFSWLNDGDDPDCVIVVEYSAGIGYARNLSGSWVSTTLLKSYFPGVSSQLDSLESEIVSLYSDRYPTSIYSYTIRLRMFGYQSNLIWAGSKLGLLFDFFSITVTYLGGTMTLLGNGSEVYETSVSEETDVLTRLSSYVGIVPRYAYLKTSMPDSNGASNRTVYTLWLSLCYDGILQSSVSLGATDNGLFTSSNVGSLLSVETSAESDLVQSTGFYIDREADNSSGGSCTFYGVADMQASVYSCILKESSFTCYMFLSPMQSDGQYASVYMFAASESDSSLCCVPGHVYYGSVAYIANGYNLSASSCAKSYSSSSLMLTLSGSAAPVFIVSSASLSWSLLSGTHKFYSDVLSSAIGSMSFTEAVLSSAGNSGNGVASAYESLYFDFNGTQIRVRAQLSLSGGVSSVTAGLVDSSGSSMDSVLVEYGGYQFLFGLKSVSWDSSSASLELSVAVPLRYDFEAGLPYQYNYSSLSYEDGKYFVDGDTVGSDYLPVGTFTESYDSETDTYGFVSSGGYSYRYNASTKEITYGNDKYDTERVGDARTTEIESLEYFEISFILQGAYKISEGEILSFTGNSITFSYNDNEYTFDFSDLMLDTALNRLAFMYTDTRDDAAVPGQTTFAVQNTESEYQFLRQAWNTLVEVENYWWIDANTILELNKETLTVLRKVSSFSDYDEDADVDVDDWGGDAWRIAFQFDRGDYLDNTVARYGVTDAYGGAVPRFWTVKLASTKSIRITFYTLSGSDYSWSLDGVSVDVQVNNVSIGSALNARANSLNTYSQLSAESLIYEAKYSGTVIDQHILFGIHHDNNFNQWALDISTNGNLNLVVQGYGFVGLDGSLTGGEIPSAYFNAALGFDSIVYPIDEIEQEDIEYVDSLNAFVSLEAEGKVIGDESQQWYITKNLTGIVSHLTWNTIEEAWDTVVLPISNNYACVYGSPSYGKRLISDFSLWGQYLTSLLCDDSLFLSAIEELTSFSDVKVYGLSPKVTTALYLQQTVGQYAYVHYNSEKPGKQRDLSREDTSDHQFGEFGVNGTAYTAIGMSIRKEDEPVEAVTAGNSDDFSFNLHGLRQSISIDKPWSGSYGAILIIFCGMAAVTSAISGVLDTLKVNEKNSQISASDFGRKFGQNFLYNMDNLATMDKTIIGILPTLQSAVGASCTLDMFYSTSEGQKVRAGPGWVQHNLVAQCVAQSVTSCQWEMQQIGMLWILDGMSSIAAKITYIGTQVAWEIVVEECNALKEQTVMSNNVGAAIAMGAIAVAGITYAAYAIYKVVAEISDMIVKSICGGTARVEVQNASSKHTYDVEGKHRYGQKSQVFMWPCFSVNDVLEYTNETVDAVLTNHEWNLHVPLYSGVSYVSGIADNLGEIKFEGVLGADRQDEDVISSFDGDIKYIIANCKSKRDDVTLPADMAAVIGSDSFLSPVPFRNENIGVSAATFPTPCIQDYIIDKDWELSRTATDGWTLWVSCKDTKLIDGEPSNIVVSDEFCGVACPYTAIEVKRGCEQKYIRPWAITPNALALNQTGYNCCYDRKAYHAFDGYGGRIVKWCGAAGMNKEGRVWQYSFIVNDRFKRSNKVPLNEFIGNFMGDPIIALRTTGEDWVFNHVTDYTGGGRGFQVGSIGEDKDSRRYAVPVFSEFVSSLPAVLKTISSYNLSVIDGITSLTSDNRDQQSAYKAPVSVDFAIGKDKYRFTEEYISKLNVDPQSGVTTLQDMVPTLGLSFLGATPYEAYLYSNATRQYYTYAGGSALNGVDTLERFRNVESGVYDFVQQEVASPCVATFERLDKHVHDDWDERDNRMVPRLKDGQFIGEVWPPIEPIYNNRSGFRLISLPSGLCYQGPNRCIINRFVYSWYMKEQIIENYGKWKKVPRERYHPFRVYEAEYERVDETVASTIVGWTHNPFLLVTSPLGVNSETDCVYEWEITFAWPVEMDELYGDKQYACVNILGECFTPGGKVIPDRPTHVFLWRDLFTRTGNYGYYSFRYQSRCGAGNRERLHIWSDQYIAVSGLQVEVKPVTEKRTEVLTQQVDVMEMEEI